MNATKILKWIHKFGNSIFILVLVFSQLGWAVGNASAQAGSSPSIIISHNNSMSYTTYTCTDPLGCVTINPTDPVHIAYALWTDNNLGIDSRNGVEIAIDDSGGKILGHDIQFDGQDDECSADGGAAAGAALAAAPTILGVIGTSCSSAAQAAMPLLYAAHMVMVSPSNTHSDLTDPASPNHYPGYFRTVPNDNVQAASAAEFAYNFLGSRKVATLQDGSSYSAGLVQAFADKFKMLGGTITLTGTIDPGATDFSSVLASIAAGSPDLIYFPIFLPAGGYIITQARATSGLKNAFLMASDGLNTPDVVTAAGTAVEGFLVTNNDPSQYSPAYKNTFLPEYKVKFGTDPLSGYHAQAYDAFMLIKAAIEKVAVQDPDGTLHIGRQSLRDALYATSDYAGLTGTLTCSPYGDCAGPDIAVYRYHAGHAQPVKIWPTVGTATIGLVTDTGGIGDMSFNYMANQGLLRAETSLGIHGFLYEPASTDDYSAALQKCVGDGNILCIAVGFSMADAVATAANANPDTKFAIVDSFPDSPPANLRGLIFASDQVAYLAGALAGRMTGSKVIGDIGGMAIPAVTMFTLGYRNGAQCANPAVQVLLGYIGNFTNPADGAAMAQNMIGQNADVIYAAAGGAGSGAILYSAQHDHWSIGVDNDQYISVFGNGTVDGADRLLTSTMKRVDNAVYQTILDTLYGSFTSGVVLYDLSNGGVGLAPFHETSGSIPQNVKDYISAIGQGIINGNIDINQTCLLPGAFNKTSPATLATNQPTNPTVKWAASSNTVSYEYCLSTAACTAASTWTSTGTATSKVLSGLTPGAKYYWQVRARNARGLTYANGGSSWSFTVLPLPGALNKTSPANAATGQPANPTLKWGASNHAAYYQYCLSTSTCTAASTWTSTGTATSKALSGLKPFKTYYWQVRAVNASGKTYANGGTGWSFKTAPLSATFQSVGAYDGWLLESSVGSAVGGSTNATSATLNLGDDRLNRQYRDILSFDTSSLPDTAVITQVTLKVMQQSIIGANPFTALGALNVDIRKPYFGTTVGLVASDFQASASLSGAGKFSATPVSSWYTANLRSSANPYVNLGGTTQFRLRFATVSNKNGVADYVSLYSGNASTAADRPVLIIQYYVP